MGNVIWFKHDDYPGYMVSADGLVLSIKFGREKVLKPRLCRGYPRVNLNGKDVFVHHFVAKVFCKKMPEHVEVNHKNGNPADARADNLEWVTKSENHRHAFAIGLKNGIHRRGERSNFAKLTSDLVLKIRGEISARTQSQAAIARKYGVTPATICMIKQNKVWAHLK